jgi:hypothetical protein
MDGPGLAAQITSRTMIRRSNTSQSQDYVIEEGNPLAASSSVKSIDRTSSISVENLQSTSPISPEELRKLIESVTNEE